MQITIRNKINGKIKHPKNNHNNEIHNLKPNT